MQEQTKTLGALKAEASKMGTTCFKAQLAMDTAAVPFNPEAAHSKGHGIIKVNATSVVAKVQYAIKDVSLGNPMIGMHIHDGNHKTNGPILVGFCGGDPLPTFSENCSQGTFVQDYEVMGMACDIMGPDSPCV